MTPSNTLFELIQSLTLSEKRYFKIYASRHVIGEENNYIRLFDAIEKQTQKSSAQYDESKIKEQFKNEKFIKHLPPEKTYLYNMIMKSLESFHKSVDSDLAGYIHRINILYNKGLYSHCRKIIEKAKAIALEQEKYPHLFELNRWEIELMRVKSYAGVKEENIIDLFDDLFVQIDKYKNSTEYAKLSARISQSLSVRGYSRSKNEMQKVESLLKNKLLQRESNALAHQSKLYFYLSHFLNAYNKDNFSLAYKNVKKLIEVIETRPAISADNPRPYIAALNNLVTCQVMLKKFQETEDVIAKLRSVQPRTQQLKNELAYSTNYVELSMCIAAGHFERGSKVIRDMQHIIDIDKSPNIRYEMMLHYNSAVINIGTGNFAAANKHVNRVLNAPADKIQNVKNDIYCFAQILRIIIHYEKGNEVLLESSLRSTYRYLLKRERLYKFEAAILDFIRKSPPASHKEAIKKLKTLKTHLEEIVKDKLERNALNYFDIISWLESKIENKLFAEIVKKKAAIP